jgi:hypothetical protein
MRREGGVLWQQCWERWLAREAPGILDALVEAPLVESFMPDLRPEPGGALALEGSRVAWRPRRSARPLSAGRRTLRRLELQQATEDPHRLGWVLSHYLARLAVRGLDLAGLARTLGCPPAVAADPGLRSAVLRQLWLCRRPACGDPCFEADLLELADMARWAGVDATRLERIVLLVERSCPAGQGRGGVPHPDVALRRPGSGRAAPEMDKIKGANL